MKIMHLLFHRRAPTLQPALRVKMRQHLLTMRQNNQEMKDITKLILQKVQRRIDDIEESTQFPDIHTRVKNDMWMKAFQELLEAQLWCDFAEAIMTALPGSFGRQPLPPRSFTSDLRTGCLFRRADSLTPT